MIGELRDVRTQLLIAVGALLLVDLGAAVVLLSPAGRSQAVRQQQYEKLRIEKIEKSLLATPAQGMDAKIATAREQETQFNDERLTGRYSAISEQLSKVATQAGVSVSNVKYEDRGENRDRNAKAVVPSGYNELSITIQIHGTYEQDMLFVNAVERQKMFLLIDAVTFSGMQGDALSVTVHLSTYLRRAA